MYAHWGQVYSLSPFNLCRALRLGSNFSLSPSPSHSPTSTASFRLELCDGLPSALASSRPARFTAALGNWGSLPRSFSNSSPVNPAWKFIRSYLLQRYSQLLSFRHHAGSSMPPRDPPSNVPQISPRVVHVAHFASFAKLNDMGNKQNANLKMVEFFVVDNKRLLQ